MVRRRSVRVDGRYDAPMLLLVDLDGVVYRGADPVPGVAALLTDRVRRGDDVVYVTNNSMHYRADYVDRLAAMGAPAAPDRIVSSPRATALWLAEQEPRPKWVLAFGGPGLRRELEDVGFEVITAGEAATLAETHGLDGFEAAGRPDAVVVGLDPGVTYRRLAVAADAIRAGALFVATNRDPTYPMERHLMPGAGSMVAAIETACGVEPISIGKPEPLLLLEAAHVVGTDPRDAIMIGDGIGTDLAAARAVGARCILMLTGVTTRAQVDALPSAERPLAVAEDAADLARILDGLSAG
jgi:glycerol-1-phosphatase